MMRFRFSNAMLAVAGVAMLCSCQLARLKRVRVTPDPVTVSVVEVKYGRTVRIRSYVGTVESAKEAVINAAHSGDLQSVAVRQGQKVDRSQLLASIGSSSLKSLHEASLAALKQAQDGYDRAQQVYSKGGITEVKMMEITTKLTQAQAAEAAAAASLEDCRIRAPFDGRIARVFVHQGERVTIDQPLFSIIDASGLEVSISVPENEIAGIRIGDMARVVFPALGTTEHVATVKEKGLIANPLSHTYNCRLNIADCPAELLSGMVGKVFLDADAGEAVVIPSDAVKLCDEGRYVWVVSDDGKVSRRIVRVSAYAGHGVVVESGLEVGEKVVMEGMDKVSTGMSVKIRKTEE